MNDYITPEWTDDLRGRWAIHTRRDLADRLVLILGRFDAFRVDCYIPGNTPAVHPLDLDELTPCGSRVNLTPPDHVALWGGQITTVVADLYFDDDDDDLPVDDDPTLTDTRRRQLAARAALADRYRGSFHNIPRYGSRGIDYENGTS